MRCIEYKIPKEKLISRIPALFAYMDYDANGKACDHKATDSGIGCYGKIVKNITINCNFCIPKYIERKIDANADFVGQDGYKYKSDGDNIEKILIIEQVLESGKTYTYRTLIDYYNQYKNKSIFIDSGNTSSTYTLVSSEGLVQNLRDWNGQTITSGTFKASDSQFIKFIEAGIGKFINPLFGNTDYPLTPKYIFAASAKGMYNDLIEMKKVCAFYRANKDKIDFDNRLCCDCEKYEQMGGDALVNILKGYIQQSESLANTYDGFSQSGLCLEFDILLISSSNDLGLLSTPIRKWEPFKHYLKEDKVFYNGLVWVCTGETTGKYIPETETVVFDDDNFVVYDPDYISSGHIDGFVNGKRGFYNSNPLNKINAVTNSKLKTLRRTTTFVNNRGEAEVPQKEYDWLFYYRVNKVTCPPRVITNNVGNICKLVNDPIYGVEITEDSATNGNELAAYGDFIESIVADTANCELTFTYYVDAHLKATSAGTARDDDNNILYKWKDFEVDKTSQFKNFGVKYVETYNYDEEGELAELLNGSFSVGGKSFDFNEYINAEYDNFKGVGNVPKFEFVIYNSEDIYQRKIHFVDKNIRTTLADYEIDRKDIDNLVYGDIKANYGEPVPISSLPWGGKTKNLYDVIKFDYYNGISYEPTKKIDVNIQRGNTALFEKHIKLGEVKTLEDMEQYQNSSFFPMNDTE